MASSIEVPREDLSKISAALNSIANKLQLFSLIDSRTLLFHQRRTATEQKLWTIQRACVIIVYAYGIIYYFVPVFLPDDKDVLDKWDEFLRYYGRSGLNRRPYDAIATSFALLSSVVSAFVVRFQATKRGRFVMSKVLESLRLLNDESSAERFGVTRDQIAALRKQTVVLHNAVRFARVVGASGVSAFVEFLF